ncbi:MAG: sigma-70 family RNA polymerase sigma factor [Pseudomonadota bacterium]
MPAAKEYDPLTWFQVYAARVVSFPKFSAKEEKQLFKRWDTHGDDRAKSLIIQSNLRYVIAIALRYRSRRVGLEDLIAEGNLGLLAALSKFDTKRDVRFATYASYWIRAYMLKLITRCSQEFRTGAGPYRSKVFFKLKRERARSLCKYGNTEAAFSDLAEKLEVDVESAITMTKIVESIDISLEANVKGAEDASLKDLLQDVGPTPEEAACDTENQIFMGGLVEKALASLDNREKYIIKRRIFNGEKVSLAEIGRDLGVSRERARQLEGRAKRKIRTCLEQSGIQSFAMIP